jgi:UDP-2,3-diacylglucosamine hydrolase
MPQKIYFASDFHLGLGTYAESLAREKKIIAWIDQKEDASAFYFVGDIFEFWFEYTHVCPKYCLRFFAKILELRAKNIEVHFFIGNHDLWMFDYFEKELAVRVHRQPLYLKLGDKTAFLAHGDGLGKGDEGYKILRKIFIHPFFTTLFKWIGPEIGMRLALFSSKNSRKYARNMHKTALEKNKLLLDFAKDKLSREKIDYFVFGHQHAPLQEKMGPAIYFNLGDWIEDDTYAVWDGEELKLEKWPST